MDQNDEDTDNGLIGGEGDYRGAYGFGRAAHGADPCASYGFEALKPRGSDGHSRLLRKRATLASVTLKDLRFDVDVDGREKACAEIEVTTIGGGADFKFAFLLENQFGDVESAVSEARERLIALFEAAACDLRSGPLRRG